MRSIVNEILTEGRVEDAKALIAKSFLPDEEHDYAEMVDYLVDNDPSGNNKYLMWMVNRMIDDNEDTTDNTEGNLIDLVTDFHSPVVQARVPSKDINYYKNTEELTDAIVIALEKVREKTSKQEVAKGTKKIVEDDRWLILHPATKESSCKYGQGTKWCTAMKDASHYEDYTKKGNLYYIIDKSKELGKYYKVALYYTWKNNEEWYDAEDNKLSDNMVELIESMLPEGYMGKIQQYHDDYEMEKIEKPLIGFDEFQSILVEIMEKWENDVVVTNSGRWDWTIDYTNDVWTWTSQSNPEVFLQATPFWDGRFEIPFDSWDESGSREDFTQTAGPESMETQNLKKEDYLNSDPDISMNHQASAFLRQIYLPLLKDVLNNKYFKDAVGNEYTTWEPTSRNASYKFENQQTSKLANAFIDYIKMAEKNGVMATRKDFLEFINKPATPGYFSSFFSAIQAAGIVNKNRKGRQFYYTLGPNYEDYLAGKLKRASE